MTKQCRKWTGILLSVAFTFLVSACSSDKNDTKEPVKEPISSLPEVDYMVMNTSGANRVKSSYAGQTSDTTIIDNSFEPNSQILSVREDSTKFYTKAESVTEQVTVATANTIIGGEFDEDMFTQVMQELGFGVYNVNYSNTSSNFYRVGENIEIHTSYTVTYKMYQLSIPQAVIDVHNVTSSVMTIKEYEGNIPPSDWPQTVVVQTLEEGINGSMSNGRAVAYPPFIQNKFINLF